MSNKSIPFKKSKTSGLDDGLKLIQNQMILNLIHCILQ
jgi:hypothetical protein